MIIFGAPVWCAKYKFKKDNKVYKYILYENEQCNFYNGRFGLW